MVVLTRLLIKAVSFSTYENREVYQALFFSAVIESHTVQWKWRMSRREGTGSKATEGFRKDLQRIISQR